jgi:hypothetical protein
MDGADKLCLIVELNQTILASTFHCVSFDITFLQPRCFPDRLLSPTIWSSSFIIPEYCSWKRSHALRASSIRQVTIKRLSEPKKMTIGSFIYTINYITIELNAE